MGRFKISVKKEKTMDYSEFGSWKNSHSTEMQNIALAKPDDIFIFIRFTEHIP